MPVESPIVAMDRSPLLQLPPGRVLVRVMSAPAQTVDGPDMGAGAILTVTGAVAMQPPPSVKEMVAVPGARPHRVPEADPSEAMPEERLQVPPERLPV
jgi:hypothetical protein